MGTRQPGVDIPPFPDLMGSIVFVAGLLVTWGTAGGNSGTDVLAHMAWGVGFSLAACFIIDMQHGLRNMVRSDVIALMAIYGLCFAEFLFPQDKYNIDNTHQWSKVAAEAVMLGMAVFALCRHLGQRQSYTQSPLFIDPVAPGLIVRLFWMAFCVGYFHQWLAVKFNPVLWIDHMMGIRWSQPWTRTHFGDWKALLFELGLFMYVVSPLAAIIIVRKEIYGKTVVTLVTIATLLNFFHAFAGGTRHVFCVHVIMFTIAFCYFKKLTPKMIGIYLCTALAIMFVTCNTMLAFRQIGLKRYIEMVGSGAVFAQVEESLYVDYTFQSLNWLMEAVPSRYDFLGWEVPYNALIRPIPRAVWKEKPIGLSTTLEEILYRPGAAGTWSVTYVGESYLAFGYLGIVVTAALFGYFANFWNSLGSPKNSDLGILIFASGFFSFSIAMRSLFTFSTAILPTLFLLFFSAYLVRNRASLLPQRGPSKQTY